MAKAKVVSSGERKVVHKEERSECCKGKNAITVEKMKELLGWEEEPESGGWGEDFLLTDRLGKKIRCANNVTNRPLYMSNCENLIETLLKKRWAGPNGIGNDSTTNGEPIIVGKTNLILNGQHTLISGILAEQDRVGVNSEHWAKYWDKPVVIDKWIIYGVEEGDHVVNTMDTCKPRSLADIIYRSEYFAKKKASYRREASRILDNAIRLLWYRTGWGSDRITAFSPRKTQMELLDFLNRHMRLLKCVAHVLDENKGSERKITHYISPGYAAGMMYLMGACKTNEDSYRKAQPAPNERKVNFDHWDRALEFWTNLANNSSNDFHDVRICLGRLNGSGRDTKLCVLSKAWNVFVGGDLPCEEDMDIEELYVTDEAGVRTIPPSNVPNVGGIDVGNPNADPDQHSGDTNKLTSKDPSPKDIEDRAESIRKQKEELAKKIRSSKGKNKGKGKDKVPMPEEVEEVAEEEEYTEEEYTEEEYTEEN